MSQEMNSLEQAIVRKDFSKIATEVLEQSNLAAYAYIHDKHSRNDASKAFLLQYTLRHQRIKQTILPLLKAWSEAGIKVMLYKGFYLAECVYEQPAARFYGDVDVIIAPEQTQQAFDIAQDLHFLCELQDLRKYHHEAFTVRSPDGLAYIEVHDTSYPLRYAFYLRRRAWITKNIWQAAQPISIDDITLYAPSPVDAILLAIFDRYLNAAEFMQHKVSDFNDLWVLKEKFNVSEAEVMARASHLRQAAVTALYLQRCNPWQSIFHITSRLRTRYWHSLRLLPRGRSAGLERAIADTPRLTREIIRESYSILYSLYQLQKIKELPELFAQNTPRQVSAPAQETLKLRRISSGVKWASLLLRPLIKLQGSGICLVRSLTLYRRLLSEGYQDIRFISGVRRDAQGVLRGHAWIEHEGKPLAIFGDMRSPQLFKENWCYPPRDEPTVPDIKEDIKKDIEEAA